MIVSGQHNLVPSGCSRFMLRWAATSRRNNGRETARLNGMDWIAVGAADSGNALLAGIRP
jgi:hypothetical protein